MVTTPPRRGLPAKFYLPIVVVFGGLFLVAMIYLVADGFGVTGGVFGKGGTAHQTAASQPQNGSAASVQGGGPPAAVMMQLKSLRDRIASHPNDDVAITQLADMYLTVSKFDQAIPLYERALKINPKNVAAQSGLDEAKSGLAQSQASQ